MLLATFESIMDRPTSRPPQEGNETESELRARLAELQEEHRYEQQRLGDRFREALDEGTLKTEDESEEAGFHEREMIEERFQIEAREVLDPISRRIEDIRRALSELQEGGMEVPDSGEIQEAREEDLPSDPPDGLANTPIPQSSLVSSCNIPPPDYLAGLDRIEKRGSKTKLRSQGGILIVQSISDIESLLRSDLLSLGILRLDPTPEQASRISDIAWQHADGKVLPMLPLTPEGRRAMFNTVHLLASEVFVKVAWTSKSLGGRLLGKSPSELSGEEIAEIAAVLRERGK